AQAIGKNSTVLDLSPSSAFAHYMAFPKWQSPDYAAVLVDNITPDEVLVERCMATAPNGITVLLAPAGGNEIREIWLRDPSRFEITLAIVDHLLELFDVVLVDQAGAEGVLPFALNCRADCRLLIAGNDAASVHLLSAAHTQMLALPGSGCVRVLQNNVHEFGLTTDDFLDFLYLGEHFEESMMLSPSVPYESKGRHWIGTGNTFYTESGSSVQEILERSLRRMINEGTEAAGLSLQESRVFSGLKRLLSRPRLKRQFVSAAKPVPRLEQNTAVNTCPAKLKPSRKTNLTMRLHLDEPPAPDAERIVPADDGGLNTKTAKEAGAGAAEAKEVITNGFFYQPPQVQDGLSNPDA
ncbi:MAG TPA: hypothetical protein PLP17_05730, partial [Oligoflexia bacterium]|nr:hypothetical protein [Oligoflexia bacterium]